MIGQEEKMRGTIIKSSQKLNTSSAEVKCVGLGLPFLCVLKLPCDRPSGLRAPGRL